MVFSILKDLLSLPVISGITAVVIPALAKKYAQFNRRDFFSRSAAEQFKAVKWLRQSSDQLTDPLEIAEQQYRLQSFGLHRDRNLSIKLIALHSDTLAPTNSYLSSLKTVLRWSGLYTLDKGEIHLRKQVKWVLPVMMLYVMVVMGMDVVSSFRSEDTFQFLLSLIVSIAAVAVWCWMAACAMKVFKISKELNAYTLPPQAIKITSDDFSSILNEC